MGDDFSIDTDEISALEGRIATREDQYRAATAPSNPGVGGFGGGELAADCGVFLTNYGPQKNEIVKWCVDTRSSLKQHRESVKALEESIEELFRSLGSALGGPR